MRRIIFLLLLISGYAQAQTFPDSTKQTGGISFTPQFNYKGTSASSSAIQLYNSAINKYFGIYSAHQSDLRYAPIGSGGVSSVFGRTGAVVAISSDYSSFYPLFNGTGATGTWGIGITGNSGTVTNGVYTTTFNALGDARYAPTVTYASNAIYKGDGTTTPVPSNLIDYGTHVASIKKFGVFTGNAVINTFAGNLNVKARIAEIDTTASYRGVDVLMQAKSTVTNTTKMFQGGHIYADLDAGNTANFTNTNYSIAGLLTGARVDVGAGGTVRTMIGIYQSNTMGGSPVTIGNMYGTLYITVQGSATLTNQAKIAMPAQNFATNNTYFLAGSRVIRTGNWFIDADSVTYASRLGGTITTTGALLKTAKSTYSSLEYLPSQRTDSLYKFNSGPVSLTNGVSALSKNIALNGASPNAWNSVNNTIDLLNGTGGSVFSNPNTVVGTGITQNAYYAGTNAVLSRLGLGNSHVLRITSGVGLIYNFRGYGAAGTSTGTQTSPLIVDTLGKLTVLSTLNATGANLSGLTPSQLVATDGSKNLVSVSALPSPTTATTQSAGDNSTKVATTAYADAAVAALSSTTPQIVGTYTLAGKTNVGAIFSYTPPADGYYRLEGVIFVNSITTNTIRSRCEWTVPSGTAVSVPGTTTSAVSPNTTQGTLIQQFIYAKAGVPIVFTIENPVGGGAQNYDIAAKLIKY